MEFELGQTYSGYKFLDVVGRSRSAVQYRVQNTLAQRVEGLRTLTAAAGDDPDAVERFLREVRIRARLSHPHIVTFYTAVPIEGRMAMTTELPDSLSLAERLHLGPLPWEEAIDITRQLLEALACIHEQSFVHRDITPENILFGPGGFCKLAEFSLARPLEAAHVTESGAVVGNPRYISPEQVKGERSLDQRSDLYSLGVVLYEMLCGRPPFESRSQFELMMAHVNVAPAPPSSLRANLPGFLDTVVLKALAKDADDRYPSATAFADALAGTNAEVAGGESAERATAPTAPAIAVAAEVPELAAVLVPVPETVAVMLEEAVREPVTGPAVAEFAATEPQIISAQEVVPEAAAVVVMEAEAEAVTEPATAECAVAEPEIVSAEEVVAEGVAVVVMEAAEAEPVIVAAEPANAEVVPEVVAVMAVEAEAVAVTEAANAEVVPEVVSVMAVEAEAELVGEAEIAEVVPAVVAVMAVEAEAEAVTEAAIAEVVPEVVAVMAVEAEAELVGEAEIAEVVPAVVAVMAVEAEAEAVTEAAIAEVVPEVVAVMAVEAEAEPVAEAANAEVVPEVVAVMAVEAEAEAVTEAANAEVVPEVVAVMAVEAEAEAVAEAAIAEVVPEVVAVMAVEAEAEVVTEAANAEVVPEVVVVMVAEAEAELVGGPATAAVVPEVVAVMVAEAEPEPQPVTVPEIGVTEPAIAECAAPELESVPVIEPAVEPASEQIAEAVEEPALVAVPELAVSSEPAIAEATVLGTCEEIGQQAKAPTPQGGGQTLLSAVPEAAAVPAPAIEAAPGAVDVASAVAALASAWITEAAVAPVTVEAVVAPAPGGVAESGARGPASWAEVGPTPAIPSGVPAEDLVVTVAAPPDPLHTNLWAAAEMVAEAVSPHAAPPVSVAPAPLPLAVAAPPAPAPAPIPQAVPEAMPPFMTRLRRAPDHLQWAVFGGAAAFLGVIWVAIWLAVGK